MVYGRDLGTVDLGGGCVSPTGPIHVTDTRLGLLAACQQFRETQAPAPTAAAPARSRQLGGFLGDPIMVISSALSTF